MFDFQWKSWLHGGNLAKIFIFRGHWSYRGEKLVKTRKNSVQKKNKGSGAVKKEDKKSLAKRLFEAAGKEAYYLGDLAIHNLEELRGHLEEFTEKEADWLASWLEYLGDPKMARDIRNNKGEFKDIVKKRHTQLRKHYKE